MGEAKMRWTYSRSERLALGALWILAGVTGWWPEDAAAAYKLPAAAHRSHSIKKEKEKVASGTAAETVKTAYDYELPGLDGHGVKLNSFRGKTLLIVNLASKSSYNSQLAGLEKLSQQYAGKGLVVIGVPCNDFGAAESDPDPALQKLYAADYKVTFPVMAKSALTGVHELPFYTWLTASKDAPKGGAVHWNYTKFLVDKNGKVVARFEQDVTPESPEMLSTLDEVLGNTYKPHPAPASEGNDLGDDEDGEPPR